MDVTQGEHCDCGRGGCSAAVTQLQAWDMKCLGVALVGPTETLQVSDGAWPLGCCVFMCPEHFSNGVQG